MALTPTKTSLMKTTFDYPAYWDEKYVICALYYLLADCDFELRREEIRVIDKKLDKLFSDSLLHSDSKYKIANEVMSYVLGLSNEEKTEAVRHLSRIAALSHDTYVKLMKDLEEIALSDDYVCIEEHSFMFFIRLMFRKNYARSTSYKVESLN